MPPERGALPSLGAGKGVGGSGDTAGDRHGCELGHQAGSAACWAGLCQTMGAV